MTLAEELMLGFDVRAPAEVRDEPGYAWFRRPAAVTFDKYVMRSRFTPRVPAARQPDFVEVPEGASDCFDLFNLWDDDLAMTRFYEAARGSEPRDGVALAFTIVPRPALSLPPLEDADGLETLIELPKRPPVVRETYRHLGYDLATEWFNGFFLGFDQDATDEALRDWLGRNLNAHSLWPADSTLEQLRELVERVDADVGEDPFFPVGIYLLWDGTGTIDAIGEDAS